jgi:hypothetical protein
VQSDADAGVLEEKIHERLVGMRIRALQHIVEIPHRLVSVNQKNELQLGHGIGSGQTGKDSVSASYLTKGIRAR